MLKRYCDVSGKEIIDRDTYKISVIDNDGLPKMPTLEICPDVFIKIKEFIHSLTGKENHA
jgi:hypothetical protein